MSQITLIQMKTVLRYLAVGGMMKIVETQNHTFARRVLEKTVVFCIAICLNKLQKRNHWYLMLKI